MYRDALPQLADASFLTDAGLETDLIFRRGVELPEFASFVLLDDPPGRQALQDYYVEHVDIARRFGVGLILEAPTWRANRDWGERLGYSPERLREANEKAVSMLVDLRRDHAADLSAPVVVSAAVGPRFDAYNPEQTMTAEEAEAYHHEQIATLAATEVDLAHAMTITNAAEAIGIARAAAREQLPIAVSFTTETDGRLPDGTSLADAIAAVDEATDSAPVYYGINCAHPSHFEGAFPADSAGGLRIRSLRANASTKSHAELDESEVLDRGDPDKLAGLYRGLRAEHPQLTMLGGCCGTDSQHIDAIAAACLA